MRQLVFIARCDPAEIEIDPETLTMKSRSPELLKRANLSRCNRSLSLFSKRGVNQPILARQHKSTTRPRKSGCSPTRNVCIISYGGLPKCLPGLPSSHLYVGCSAFFSLTPSAAKSELREHVTERIGASTLLFALQALLAEPVVGIPG